MLLVIIQAQNLIDYITAHLKFLRHWKKACLIIKFRLLHRINCSKPFGSIIPTQIDRYSTCKMTARFSRLNFNGRRTRRTRKEEENENGEQEEVEEKQEDGEQE